MLVGTLVNTVYQYKQKAMSTDSTARQWATILDTMHSLSTTDRKPVPARRIAQHTGMGRLDVERHLRLMARVGLVCRTGRGQARGWLLGRERP